MQNTAAASCINFEDRTIKAVIAEFTSALERFVASFERMIGNGYRSSHIECRFIKVYVRMTPVSDGQAFYPAITVASVDVAPDFVGRGIWKYVEAQLFELCRKTGRVFVIENVLNERFVQHFDKDSRFTKTGEYVPTFTARLTAQPIPEDQRMDYVFNRVPFPVVDDVELRTKLFDLFDLETRRSLGIRSFDITQSKRIDSDHRLTFELKRPLTLCGLAGILHLVSTVSDAQPMGMCSADTVLSFYI